jgi:hypothetical protein
MKEMEKQKKKIEKKMRKRKKAAGDQIGPDSVSATAHTDSVPNRYAPGVCFRRQVGPPCQGRPQPLAGVPPLPDSSPTVRCAHAPNPSPYCKQPGTYKYPRIFSPDPLSSSRAKRRRNDEIAR